MTTPPTAKHRCHFCGCPIDPRTETVFRQVEGWVKNRKQGGTNAISLPVAKPGWACGPCIDLRSTRKDLAQTESLF